MATYLLNIHPTRLLNNLTPMHLLYNKAPSYDHLRTFGCLCYPNLPATSPHKLIPRSTPCIFLGYPTSHRGYRCYDIQSKKIIIYRHVTFDESTFPYSSTYVPNSKDYEFLVPPPPQPNTAEPTPTPPLSHFHPLSCSPGPPIPFRGPSPRAESSSTVDPSGHNSPTATRGTVQSTTCQPRITQPLGSVSPIMDQAQQQIESPSLSSSHESSPFSPTGL